MKEDYYILQDGELIRKENTIWFQNQNIKRALPVERIYTLYAYGKLNLTSGVISYLAKNKIPVHFFNYYGFYIGSLYPREMLVSGDLLVRQVEHYLNPLKRLFLAHRLVEGAAGNILKNLQYYIRKGYPLKSFQTKIEETLATLPKATSIPKTMSVEGKIREVYYHALDEVFPEDYRIGKRTRQPPGNKSNTLLSFGNSLLYTTILSEIYNTQLNPTVSYLHEPFDRRFSLALDISEIFKPFIVDRVIFKLILKNMLDKGCFQGEIGDMALTEKGKRLFLKEYHQRLERTIYHRGVKRKVSYKRLIRMELYKLINHLLGTGKYKPFVMWW